MITVAIHDSYNWVESISDSYLFMDKDISLDSKWFFMLLWNYRGDTFANKKTFIWIIRIWETSYKRILKELWRDKYIEQIAIRDKWKIIWYKIILDPFPNLI